MNNLKKVKNEFTIVEADEEVLLSINRRDEKIKIYDQELLEEIIDTNFNKKYRDLLYLAMTIIDDEDSTESDTELALLKIEDLKSYILSHYHKYISKNIINKYFKMLIMLEEKLNVPRRGRGR